MCCYTTEMATTHLTRLVFLGRLSGACGRGGCYNQDLWPCARHAPNSVGESSLPPLLGGPGRPQGCSSAFLPWRSELTQAPAALSPEDWPTVREAQTLSLQQFSAVRSHEPCVELKPLHRNAGANFQAHGAEIMDSSCVRLQAEEDFSYRKCSLPVTGSRIDSQCRICILALRANLRKHTCTTVALGKMLSEF